MDTDNENFKKIIWQYIIDHSQIQSNGYYGVQLYFRDKEDFWKRVEDRKNGFKRYTEEQKELISLRKQKIYRKYHQLRDSKEQYELQLEKIKHHGTFIEKMLLKIYFKINKYLFKKHEI